MDPTLGGLGDSVFEFVGVNDSAQIGWEAVDVTSLRRVAMWTVKADLHHLRGGALLDHGSAHLASAWGPLGSVDHSSADHLMAVYGATG